jgi:hypothetical protein
VGLAMTLLHLMQPAAVLAAVLVMPLVLVTERNLLLRTPWTSTIS